ncbi:response regulator [Acuticoccus sp. MNP-M23]|uniref:response regulator n=1 Tax=Acuticoccus sp. MNP-M23 TaxID=3072793 RepID=UPI0028153733|nr:response regulator [Acuticoccus sp. MNP-M23]WMS42088.1 response regulator [Acuticoccus sp. MNP-M23]
MSLAQTIAPHIPYLRRFARSLTGSQPSGDAYVEAVLQALVADSALYETKLPPRVALYRILIKVWDSVAVNNDVEERTELFEKRLDSMVPRARQAFLLTTVEGFSVQEAAAILNTDVAGVRGLIDDAGRSIADQVATSVLIIEDEPMIALDLESLVESLGHEVAGIARTHTEAIDAVNSRQPGLVLADIQLADGSSGLDAVNEILSTMNVPVIFITAYPERLLTGDRPEPAFLITKPFETDTVKAVISQALFFSTGAAG